MKVIYIEDPTDESCRILLIAEKGDDPVKLKMVKDTIEAGAFKN